MARNRSNDTSTIALLICGIVAFIVGINYSKKQKELEQAALEVAMQEGVKAGQTYVKQQVDVTKNWFNQLTNTWKQIWK